jgi:Tfp pilus assembly protein PilO
MAISLRELPVYIQVLVFVALAVGIILAFEYAPFSPLLTTRAELKRKQDESAKLQNEVTALQVFDRQKGELKQAIDALNKELERRKAVVPEEKQVDEFIRTVQGEAIAVGVAVRRVTSKPTIPREYKEYQYVEVPFEMEADGAYYSVLDFFSRVGRVPLVINVSDLALTGTAGEGKAKKFPFRPGTSVTGTFTVTTFYSKPAEAARAAPPAKQPATPQPKG